MSAITAFALVAQAVEEALKAYPQLAGGNVKANPTRAWAAEVSSCIAVRLIAAHRVDGTNCGETWALSLAAECEARRSRASEDPAEVVDELLSAVAARIAELNLSALGVTQRTTDDSIAWEHDATESTAAAAILRFGYEINVTDRYTAPAP